MKNLTRLRLFYKVIIAIILPIAGTLSAAELNKSSMKAVAESGKISEKMGGFIFEGEESYNFPIFKIIPKNKDDAFNLADYKYVSITVKNLSDKNIRFSLWAHSGHGYSGATSENKDQCTLSPDEEKTFKIDLETRFPGNDALFDCVDRSKITSVELVANRVGPTKKDSVGHSIYPNPLKLLIKDIAPCGKPLKPFNKEALSARYVTPEIQPVGTFPKAGIRFYRKLKGYENTNIVHAVFLPNNWQKGKKYPLIVEYTGNVFYHPKGYCYSTGFLNQANMGSALSRGEDFIVLTLPFISKDGKREQFDAWGDPDLAVKYCLEALDDAEKYFGSDPRAYVFTGFSRGEIAANYIALRTDEIAKKWLCFVRASSSVWPSKWNGAQYGWEERMARLGKREVLNCAPKYGSVHVDTMFNEDTPACIQTRQKLKEIVAKALGTDSASQDK